MSTLRGAYTHTSLKSLSTYEVLMFQDLSSGLHVKGFELSPHLVSSIDNESMWYFSGVRAVQKSFQRGGFKALDYDIVNTPAAASKYMFDITDTFVFLTALRFGMRLKVRALAHSAIVCSNLVYLCRAKTERCDTNQFWGNPAFQKVRDANMMIQRMMLVWIVLVCRRVRWMNEQPGSSCLRFIPHMKHIPSPYGGSETKEVHGFMGSFGSRTQKPTYWSGDCEFIGNMKQPLPSPSSFAKTDLVVFRPDGRVTGRKHEVKKTQEYTDAYGEHVFRQWMESVAVHGTEISDDHVFSDSESDASLDDTEWQKITYDQNIETYWGFAGLRTLAGDLNLPLDELLAERM